MGIGERLHSLFTSMHHLPILKYGSCGLSRYQRYLFTPTFWCLLLHPRPRPSHRILALCPGEHDGSLGNVTKDTGWHSGELWYLIPWSCLSGPLVLDSILYPLISALPPAFGGSHGIHSRFYRLQLLVCLSAQLVSGSLCQGEETFYYLTWGSRNPSRPGEASCCLSPASHNFLPPSSHRREIQ